MADTYYSLNGNDVALFDNGNSTFAQGVSVVASMKKCSSSQTRPNDTTAYTAGDVIGVSPAANMSFATGLVQGSGFLITGATLEVDVASVPSGMSTFRLHLYDSEPTAIADNAAYDLPSGDRTKYLGNITLNTPSDLGSTLWSQTDNINFNGKLATSSSTLYGLLETTGAYTPTAETVKKVTLFISPM